MRLPCFARRWNSRKSGWIMGISSRFRPSPRDARGGAESSIDSFQFTDKRSLLLHYFRLARIIRGRVTVFWKEGAAALTPKCLERSFAPDGRSGQTLFVECLVNHNRYPLPLFFVSVNFKGTLSCSRINTCGSVDSKGS